MSSARSLFALLSLKRLVLLGAMVALCVLAFALQTRAANGINRQINYQAKLMDSTGTTVVNGSYAIKFSIYNTATGGTALWTASGTTATPVGLNVSVSNGLFTVLLGDTATSSGSQNAFGNQIDWNSDSLYLGVTVGADGEMTPRKRLASTPYAFNAERLQGMSASGTAFGADSLFTVNQTSNTSATGTRSALEVRSSGTSDANDFLIRGINDVSSAVFSVNRQGNVTSSGYLAVTGSATSSFTGNVSFLSSTVLGDASSDLITLNGRINTDVVPIRNQAYDLGTSMLAWRNLYVSSTVFGGMVTTTNLFAQNVQLGSATATTLNVLGGANVLYSTSTVTRSLDTLGLAGISWIKIHGDYLYATTYDTVTGSIQIVDISDPANMKVISSSSTDAAIQPGDLAIAGNYGYLLNWSLSQTQLLVLDLSNPSSSLPIVSRYTFPSGPWYANVSGNYLYVSRDGAVDILDIVNPANPRLVRSVSMPTARAQIMSIRWPYLYTSGRDSGAFYVIDISDPATASIVGGFTTGLDCLINLGIYNSYAYLTDCTTNNFFVADIGDPTDPYVVSTSTVPTGGWSEIVGSDLYFSNYDSGIRVFDLSNPLLPNLVKLIVMPNGVTNFQVQGDKIFNASISPTLESYDMGGIEINGLFAHAAKLGSVNVLGDAIINRSLYVWNGLTVGGSGLRVEGALGIYATNTTSTVYGNLELVGLTSSTNLLVSGYRVCLANGTNCPTTSSTSDWIYTATGDFLQTTTGTTNIVLGGTSTTDFGLNSAFVMDGNDLFVNGNIGSVSSVYTNGAFIAGSSTYVGDGFINQMQGNLVLNAAGGYITPSTDLGVSLGSSSLRYNAYFGNVTTTNFATTGLISRQISSETPVTLLSQVTAGAGGIWQNVFVSGKYAVTTNEQDSTFSIYNVENPSYPELLVTSSTPATGPWRPYIAGSNLFLAFYDTDRVAIIDITEPKSPRTLSQSIISFQPDQLQVVGSYLYVPSNSNLDIYDIRNPSAPVLLSNLTVGTGRNYGMYIQRGIAYVSNFDNSLYIVDVRNPATPSILGSLPFSMSLGGLVARDGYVYVTEFGGSNLFTVDVTSPTSPMTVATTTGITYGSHMVMQGDYIYTTEDTTGEVSILSIASSTSPEVVRTFAVEGAGANMDLKVQGNTIFVVGDTSQKLSIYDIGGAAFSTLVADGAEIGSLAVLNDTRISNNLTVGNGLSVGIAGIFAEGAVISSTGTSSFGDLKSNGQYVCLANGTNCPTSSSGTSTADYNWRYDAAGDFIYTATNTSNVLIGGTSTTETGLNAAFVIDGNDLFVNGNIGSVSSVYTNGAFVAGAGSTHFGDGYIFKNTQGELDFSTVSGTRMVNSLNNIITNGTAMYYRGIKYTEGITYGISVYGKYGYITNNNTDTLSILDVTNPDAPQVLTSVAVASQPKYLYASERYVYVGSTNQLSIVDVKNPETASIVGTVPLGIYQNAENLYASGRYVYLLNNNGTDDALHVIDVSNPTSPTTTGRLTGLTNPAGLAVDGPRAYFTEVSTHLLKVVDVSDKSNPVLTGTLDLGVGTQPNTVVAQGPYAYVALFGTSELAVVNVASSTPSLVATVSLPNPPQNGQSISLNGRYIYVSGGNDLMTVDVSDPANPVVVNDFPISDIFVRGLTVQGRYAYISIGGSDPGGVQIVDMSGIEASSLIAHSAEIGRLNVLNDAQLAGSLYVGNGVIVGNSGINSEGGISIFSEFASSTISGFVSASSVNVTGDLTTGDILPHTDLLYTVGNASLRYNAYFGSVTTTDLGVDGLLSNVITSNTPFPVLGSFDDDVAGMYGFPVVHGNIAYLPDADNNRIHIVDVANPASPTLVYSSTTGPGFYPIKLLVSGSYGFLSQLDNQIQVVTIGSPSSTTSTLQSIANVTLPYTYIADYYLSGKLLYVVGDLGQFSVVDISNPYSPVVVANKALFGPLFASPYSVDVQGDYAYVASGQDLFVVDVKEPQNLSLAGGVNDAGYVFTYVKTAGKYAYAVSNGTDIIVFDIANPASPVQVASVSGFSNANSLVVSGRYVYVMDSSAGEIVVIDVSNPLDPTTVKTVSAGFNPYYAVIEGHKLYVEGDTGFKIFETGGIETSAFAAGSAQIGGLQVTNNASFLNDVYVGNGLNIGPGGLQVNGSLGVYATGTTSTIAGQLTVFGQYVCLANGTNCPSGSGAESVWTFLATGDYARLSTSTSDLVVGTLATSTGAPLYVDVNAEHDEGEIWANVYLGYSTDTNVLIGGTSTTQTGITNFGFSGDDLFVHGGIGSVDSVRTNGAFVVGSTSYASGTITTIGDNNLQLSANGGFVLPTSDLGLSLGSSSVRFNGVFGSVTTTYATTTDLFASGTVSTTQLFVNGSSVCLQNGTNCPSTSGAVDWVYTATGDYLRPSTSTTDIVLGNTSTSTGAVAYFDLSGTANGTSTVYFGFATNTNVLIGGTSTSQTGLNSAFVFDGNDLFIAGNLGVASSVYSNGDFISGTGSTRFGNGYIAKNDGNFTFAVSGGSILPSSDLGIAIGSSSARFNANLGNVTSTNGTSTNFYAGSLTVGTFNPTTLNALNVSSTNVTTTNVDLMDSINQTVTSTAAYRQLSTITLSTAAQQSLVDGRYVYTPDYAGNRISITDVADPANPRKITNFAPTLGTGPRFMSISGKYLYVTLWDTGILDVIDISNPSRPVEVGSISVGSQPEHALARGRYVYVSFNGGMSIFDVNDPTTPRLVKSLSFDSGRRTWGLDYRNGFIYTMTDVGGSFRTIDVREPANAVVMSSLSTGISGTGVPNGLSVQGRYAYVIGGGASGLLKIVDISVPTSTVVVGSLSGFNSPEYIEVYGRYAYIANSGASTISVVDVSSSTLPVVAKTLTGYTSANGAVQNGRYVYVTLAGGTLSILQAPGATFEGLYADAAEFGNLQVRGNASINNSLSIGGGLNIGPGGIASDGAFSINATGTTSTITGALQVAGVSSTLVRTDNLALSNTINITNGSLNMAYGTTSAVLTGSTGAGTQQITLRAPSGTRVLANLDNPVTAASTVFKRAQGSIVTGNVNDTVSRVVLEGRYAYLAVQRTGVADLLQILDISNPGSPSSVGSVAVGTLLSDLSISGHYAYLSDTQDSSKSMWIVDISNPAAPFIVGSLARSSPVLRDPASIFVQGKIAYVGHARDGIGAGGIFSTVDISSPNNPTVLSSVDLGFAGTTAGMYVQGRYAYIVNNQLSALKIIDVGNPNSISIVGSVGVVGLPTDVRVQGGYAYVGGGSSSNISVVNVMNPAAPYVVSTFTVVGASLGSMQVSGKYLYMGSNGLYQVDISNPSSPVLVNTSASMGGCTKISISGRNGFCAGNNSGVVYYSFDTTGADLGAATIAQAEIGELQVLDNAFIGNRLNVGGALSVGINGIISQGGITIVATTTAGNITTNGSYIAGATTYASGTVTVVGSNSLTYAIGGGFILPSSDLGVSIGSSSFRFNAVFGSVTATSVTTTNLFFTNASGTNASTTNFAVTGSSTSTFNGSIVTRGNVSGTRGMFNALAVGGQSVCLANGTNCPSTSSSGTSTIDFNWRYTTAGDFVRMTTSTSDLVFGNTSTSTGAAAYFDLSGGTNGTSTVYFGFATNTNVVLGGTSTTQTGLNNLFTMNGDDLFVGGNIGSASSVYTNGAFVAGGTTSTSYASSGISTNNYTYNFVTKGTDPDLGLTGTPSYNFVTTDSVQRDIAKFTFAPGGYSVRLGYDGSVYADGYVTSSLGFKVGNVNVCLQNGTNCPTSSSGTSTSDFNWRYNTAGDFIYTATATTNLLIGGTSTTDTGLNSAFAINGNDLFVNGNIGAVSSVFTNGEFVVGTGSAHYGDGYIRQSSGNITISAAGGSILPNSDLGLTLGSGLLRFNGVFGNVSSSNVTSSRLYVPESTYATIGGISTFPTQSSKTTLGGYSTLALFGRYAIVAGYSENKIQVLDVNDPSAPTLLASTSTNNGPWNPIFDGRYLYVHFFSAGEVLIFDLQHPTETSLDVPVGKLGGFSSPDGLFLSGSTLYITDSSGKLFTANVSNPRAPYILGTVSLPGASGRSRGLVVQNGTAYITNEGAATFYVVDVSNPASPMVKGSWASNLDDLQELAVVGNYAYAYSYIAEALATFDITSSTNPRQLTYTVFSGVSVKRLVASGQYLYGAETDKIAVFDITSSTNPTLSARFGSEDLTGAHDLKVQGRYVYIQDQSSSQLFIKQIPGIEASGLMAHDAELGKLVVLEDGTISNRLFVGDAIMVGMGGIMSEGPVSVSSINTTSTFSGNVTVNGGFDMAFTSSTPVESVYATSSNIATLYGVGARGNTAVVLDEGVGTNNIHIYDISDLNHMKNPKTIHLFNNWPYEVAFGGRYAYISAQGPGSQRFVIVDTQASSGPAVVGSSNQMTQNAAGVAVAGKYAYVVDSANNSVTTFNVSSHTHPEVVSVVTGLTSAQEIAVQGRYAYVTENSGGGGLAILDLEDPANPSLLNTFAGASFNQPYGVAVQGNYAYVTNFSADNVVVVDISNPMDPFEVRVLTSSSIDGPQGISIQGRYGYVANGLSNKLVMFDATNPSQAFLLPDLGRGASKVAVNGSLVLATDNGSPNTFRIYDVGGMDVTNVKSDSVKTYSLEVMGDANIGNRVNAGGGLTVGQGGAQIDGGLVVTDHSASSVASFVNTATSSNENWGAYINKLLVGNNYTTGSNDFAMVVTHSPLTDGLCITQDIHHCPDRTGTPVSIVADNSIAANAFDVAERFPLNGFAEEGDLLILDQSNNRTVKQSDGTPYDGRMIGVYSTDPGFLLGFGNSGAPVALTGRVPLKVSTMNGTIDVGDPLTSSPAAGYAMKATHPGMVVGYALEATTGTTSTISVFVNVGFDAKMALGTDATGQITQVTDDFVFSATSTATSTNPFVDSWGLTFRGSAWNGTDAVSQDFRLFTDILSATTSKFTISNTSSSNVFTINQAGAAELTGDLSIGGKFYPSARGTFQSDKYIFLDDSLGPTSTYMSTNADGWQSETSYDFAERFYSPDDLSPGDVVTISQVGQSHVQRSSDERAMPVGIVSTRPAFVAGAQASSTYPIALAGRVPTNVSTIKGLIKAGDALAPTSIPGVAAKAVSAGPIVGYALEDYAGTDVGKIQVYVNPGWHGGSSSDASTGSGSAAGFSGGASGFAVVYAGQTSVQVSFASLGAFPMVQVTPYGEVSGSWWIRSVSDTGFEIVFRDVLVHDVMFAWQAAPSRTGQRMSFSDGTEGDFDPSTGIPFGSRNTPVDETPSSAGSTSTDMGSASSTDGSTGAGEP